MARPWPRFHTPLIEPDWQISRIRLTDKTSRLHPRHVVPKPAQAYEPKVPVKMREWIGPALASLRYSQTDRKTACCTEEHRMSEVGQSLPNWAVGATSAFPPLATR